MADAPSYLDPVQVASQASHQEGISAKWRDAHELAEVDKMDALQVVKRELIVEELGKLGDLKVVHVLARSNLQGST